MKRPRPSLESFVPPPEPDQPAPAQPIERRSAPHVSVYLSKKVQRAIRGIAFEYDLKQHDVYVQAIDLLLARYGRPSVAEIDSDNVTTLPRDTGTT
jgi:hypothetical protein